MEKGLIETYENLVAMLVARKDWVNGMAQQGRPTIRMLIEVCGDKPMAKYSKADATQFQRMPFKMPSKYFHNSTLRKIHRSQSIAVLDLSVDHMQKMEIISIK